MQSKKPCILLVEDEDNDVVLLKRGLRRAGVHYHLSLCEDSSSAIDYFCGTGRFARRDICPFPDLLVLDIKLVSSNGFDVLVWLSGRPERDRVVEVVFTSAWSQANFERARDLGADDYRGKPNGFDDLVEICRDFSAMLPEKPQTRDSGNRAGAGKTEHLRLRAGGG